MFSSFKQAVIFKIANGTLNELNPELFPLVDETKQDWF
jgi:hypothetical protein